MLRRNFLLSAAGLPLTAATTTRPDQVLLNGNIYTARQGAGFRQVRRAAQTPKGQWDLDFKYDDTKTSEGRKIALTGLDAAAPDHPVAIRHRGGLADRGISTDPEYRSVENSLPWRKI